MKHVIVFCLSAWLACLPARAADPYDGSWESLQKMPVPAWFDDGKIGIFIHWGPYSVLGYIKGDRGYAEQVAKAIYSDPKHLYPLLKQRFGAAPPEFGYKDMVDHFKAEKWDPEAWATLFDEVGAKYVVLTAEHHDGWANWDSDLTPWNAMDKGPKRDLVGELGAAVRKRGLKYAPSTHRERHHMYFSSKSYVADGEPHPDIAKEIELNPEAATPSVPTGRSISTKFRSSFSRVRMFTRFPSFTQRLQNFLHAISRVRAKPSNPPRLRRSPIVWARL